MSKNCKIREKPDSEELMQMKNESSRKNSALKEQKLRCESKNSQSKFITI